MTENEAKEVFAKDVWVRNQASAASQNGACGSRGDDDFRENWSEFRKGFAAALTAIEHACITGRKGPWFCGYMTGCDWLEKNKPKVRAWRVRAKPPYTVASFTYMHNGNREHNGVDASVREIVVYSDTEPEPSNGYDIQVEEVVE